MLRKVPLIVILGSTGTGKTKLSLELAERFGGEVISADSMQVYPNLDVVTAKATKEEQAKAPHHLLDVASPSDPFTVVHFRNLALPIINDLLSKSKSPIVVGGTNYYIESLLWDILVSPPSPADRSAMTQSCTPPKNINELELEKLPSDKLHARLREIDSITADRLHPNNKRKIIRALEVFQETGVPLSAILNEQRNRPGGNRLGGPLRYPHTILFWLQCNQIVLDERLDKRVDSMLEQGLLKEIRNFYNEHLNTDNPKGFTQGVLQTIGFKEFIPYLEKFNADQDFIIENYLKDRNFIITDDINDTEKPEGLDLLKSCLDELKLVTRRYSKKQIKWVRNRFLGSKDRQVPPLYSLDTSDVSNWQSSVYNPAVEVVESYMNEKQPQLAPLKPLVHPSAGLNEEVSNYCEVCKRHFIGEFQWRLHLKSNKHKRVKDSHNRKKKTNKLNTK